MSSTYTLDDVPERLRARYAAMPPELLAAALATLGQARDSRLAEERARKIVLPEAPVVNEREMVTEALRRRYGADGNGALTPERQREVDAQLGCTSPDRDLYPHAHNQPVRMLTLTEAAQVLGVSTSTVWRLTRGRGLPSVRLGKVVRVRSDHVWAIRNRLAAGRPLDGRELVRHRAGALYRGVPLEQVAATLRVHPQTLWRLGRHYAAVAEPGAPVTDLPWRVTGRRTRALIPEDVLTSWEVPYDKSSLRLIRHIDLHRYSAEQKKLITALTRHKDLAPEKVRRTDSVRDAVSGTRMHTMAEAARMLQLTVSGAHKAITRAGIATELMGGVRRVRHDDLVLLLHQRLLRLIIQSAGGLPALRLRSSAKSDADPEPAMVPIVEAARRIGVTARTLRRRAAAGKIELVVFDGKLLVRRHEVRAAGTGAERDELRERRREQAASTPRRGAALTQAHFDSFVAWMRWRYPDMDPASALYTRARAAIHAGCRPSVIEELVSQGLIPARRHGRDLQIRMVDLVAAGVFSAKVARMCPKLRVTDTAARRNVESEFLSFDQAARFLARPASEVRYLANIGTLNAVRFGNGSRRLHESELFGPGKARFEQNARPYRQYTPLRPFGFGHTVNDAANLIGVSERTVLRMVARGALTAIEATKQKWRRGPIGVLLKMPVVVNHGGLLVSERSVATARRLRQVRGELPRDEVPITVEHVRAGTAAGLQPWQRYFLVDERGNRLDEYGRPLAG